VNLRVLQGLFEHKLPLWLRAEVSIVSIGRQISTLDCTRIQTRMADAHKLQNSHRQINSLPGAHIHNINNRSKEAARRVVGGRDRQGRREAAEGSPADLQGRLVMREPKSMHDCHARNEVPL